MNELIGLGYNAEIVRFPRSNFFSVSVGRFDDRRDADQLKREVEKHKIDAFVRAAN
jgi:hypothetical protein